MLKGGDPSNLDNYRPISKLSVIVTILESIVSEQLKQFLVSNSILSVFQSGFRKNHSTTTATMKVLNYTISAQDDHKSCAALFIDLTKAFDTVNHAISLSSDAAIGWVSSYLNNSCQRVLLNDYMSEKLTVNSGVLQGSILGPLVFTVYINNLSENVINAQMHLYADDIIIYCSAKSPAETILRLQKAFENIQLNLQAFNLVLNDKKTKCMFFTRTRKPGPSLPQLHTLQGRPIESVCSYKYLGFIGGKHVF